MTEQTPRLSLPLLDAAQAQKEMTHNEALALLDIAAQPVVQGMGVNAPPPQPVAGQCWITGPDPQGDWAGQPDRLAGWTNAGWRFLTPQPGWSARDATSLATVVRTSSGWEAGVVRGRILSTDGVQGGGPQAPAIAAPTGGSTIDVEARATLDAVLSALRTHGLVAV